MNSVHHHCEDCESEFTLRYDENKCEDDPIYCPFCSAYILDLEESGDEDE